MHRYVQNRVFFCLRITLFITDWLAVNLIFLLSKAFFLSSYEDKLLVGYNSVNWNGIWMVYNLSWLTAVAIVKLYGHEVCERLERIYRATWRGAFLQLVFFCSYLLLENRLGIRGGSFFLVSTLFLFCISYTISRMVLTYGYAKLPGKLKGVKRVALIGHNNYLQPVIDIFSESQAFYTIDTFEYDGDESKMSREDNIKRFKNYFEQVSSIGIHDVFIIASPAVHEFTEELVIAADQKCVQVNFVSPLTASVAYLERKGGEHLRMELPIIKSHGEPGYTIENRLKRRVFDLLLSGFVLLFILSWLIPIIGIIIKIQSPGPVFFKQLRSGRNNKPFYCYKFRSMVVNKDSDAKQATKNDKRITAIGKFLRKTNLDEFPQFINVFLGNMSVVGPRPHMLSHTEHYSKLIQHYMVRHFVKPGITGWAQVNGYRGETIDPNLMAKRVQHDIEYMRNWTVMLDVKIVFLTVFNMLRGEKNAY
ncbi:MULTISPECIES: exopolysaccharide biosynthesis polyprenyl glycosylphosphotransferase [Sphingobacterium]|uniref:exopolysaccharide biosynthesis polyprenyl glycosylphosphotransferase n=1 Tax=Sphingobacterium TaxID=28453 RepID=UPI00257EBE80|nr:MULTISPECIES: exopolysaccharide biosynthesis polyprenyl glycosylphosphotransferase [Sphingobacterium]